MASDQDYTESIMPLMRYNANWKDGFVTMDEYVK